MQEHADQGLIAPITQPATSPLLNDDEDDANRKLIFDEHFCFRCTAILSSYLLGCDYPQACPTAPHIQTLVHTALRRLKAWWVQEVPLQKTGPMMALRPPATQITTFHQALRTQLPQRRGVLSSQPTLTLAMIVVGTLDLTPPPPSGVLRRERDSTQDAWKSPWRRI